MTGRTRRQATSSARFNVLVSRDGGVTDRHVQSLQDAARLAYEPVDDTGRGVHICERADAETIRLIGPYTDEVRDAVVDFIFSSSRAERNLLEVGEAPYWRLTCEWPGLADMPPASAGGQ